MKTAIMALALAAFISPLAVLAQTSPDSNGPPPEMRAKMEQMRTDAHTSAYAQLSADHRTKVQAIVDQFNAGKLDHKTASQQIDAVLSPAESANLLKQAQSFHDSMRSMMGGPPPGAPGPPGAPQNGPPPQGGQAMGEHHHHTPDAGRFLLMVSASPDKLYEGRPEHPR